MAGDEPKILSLGRMYLEREGYRVKLAADGEETLASVERDKPALMVLSREQLLEQAWGYGYPGGTRTVDVHIGHLRKKLADSNVRVKTVTGIGYRLVVEG